MNDENDCGNRSGDEIMNCDDVMTMGCGMMMMMIMMMIAAEDMIVEVVIIVVVEVDFYGKLYMIFAKCLNNIFIYLFI